MANKTLKRPEDKRTFVIGVGVTKEEMEKIEKAASERYMSKSTYCRLKIFGKNTEE